MRPVLTLVLLVVVSHPALAEPAITPLAAIQIYHRGKLLRTFRRPGERLRLSLDLGVAIKDLRLVVRQTGGQEIPIRVEQHELTSLTVMAGGPHIDLLAWKHGRSASRELPPSSRGYRLLAPGVPSAFPAVTPREVARALRAELRRQGFASEETESWLVAARRCTTVRTYPCDVGLSHVVLRVLASDRRVLAELAVEVPLGC